MSLCAVSRFLEENPALDAAVSGSIEAGWAVENSSFSLAVISYDQEDPGVPVWEYHHLSSENTRGTEHLDRDSQYLIGSISKVITVYILLKSGIDLDAPVAGLLPPLRNPDSTIPWQNITLRMLASHLGGIPVNFFLAYGLPPIDVSEYPPCGVTALNSACSDQQILDGMTKSYPVTAPMEGPAYSNSAFVIIGMALEEFTGKNYTELVQQVVSNPLDLKNTGSSPGDDERAVIPPVDNSWGSEYGQNNPAGGLVSSVADLSKFSHALLSRTLDLTSIEIDAWLKPASFAGGPHSTTGMPWEILRPLDLTPDHPHTVSIYGKNGAAFAYRSQLSFVDDYGIAVLILTAGPMRAANILTNAMLSTFVPAVDKVSRHQAKKYEGNFTSREGTDAPIEASIVQDRDSLVLSSLHRNGSAIDLIELWSVTMGDFIPKLNPPIRIFPTELATSSILDGKPIVREVWHLRADLSSSSKTELPGKDLENQDCVTWTIGDWVYYGGEPLDRILVNRDENGDVIVT
ncbi:hypothetical protein G7Z17_g12362 [Cylindrodendrum hubeiense]|uniref:Beta-lactamase-related domain-containing protein n=1 Tax=Cylindrodendrum hubeiense TaxID=595255 RepID=A0A9P5GVL1_9HYPO|nr:hypothetical protein G7Z17_g12362 [Cylindrodendrum hubeiense]